MIRRKFMKFAPKEHSDEKVKKSLEKHNVPTFEGHQPAKFSQFGNVAKDLAAKSRKTFETPDGGHVAPADKTFSWQQKAIYGGGTGHVSGGQVDSHNPYAVVQPQGNPYASNPYGGGAPGGGAPGGNANPYGGGNAQAAPEPAASKGSRGNYPSAPYNDRASGNPYGGGAEPPAAARPANPYSRAGAGASGDAAAATAAYSSGRSGGPSGRGPASSASSMSASAKSGVTSGAASGTTRISLEEAYQQEYGDIPGDIPEEYAQSMQPPAGVNNTAAIDSQRPPQQYNEYAPRRPQQQPRDGPQQEPFTEPFGEPLRRTQTNQSTSTVNAARQQLFGAAPRRLNPDAPEFDELNRLPTEFEEEDELLAETSLDRPQYLRGAAASGVAAGPVLSQSGVPEDPSEIDPEDELNQLPSQFDRAESIANVAPVGEGAYGMGPTYGTGNYAYGGSQSGQQLFEDSEDEDIDYVKREIRQTKQESVESTRRALQIAAEAETSGRNAMGMLGDQGERLGNSAKTVALGHVQARVGERNAEELQRLNRSIFIPNVSNPFNSRRRNQMREQKLKSERRFDELEREELERQQRESEQRVADGLNSAGYGYSETAIRARQRMNRDNPERKMYQFEADSDDDALEDELDQNLDGISQAAKRLHGLSLKINDEVTDQNARIEQMGGRVDELDYSLHKSTAKMATIN